jgi:hypothetical protein
VQPRQWLHRGVLGAQSLGAFLECSCISGGPPVSKAILRIGLPPLIVKTVCQFMTDHAPERAVVDGGVGFRIEERRLLACRR